MASNGAAQTAQAQQGQQQQSEQFLQQQQAAAFANLQKYMAGHPDPANQWAALKGPNMPGAQQIGGGMAGPQGMAAPQGMRIPEQHAGPPGGPGQGPPPGGVTPGGGGHPGTWGGGPPQAPAPGPGRIPLSGQPTPGASQGGGAQNPFMKVLGPTDNAHGTAGANSGATNPGIPPQIQAAAQSNPQLAAYVQAWQAMQAKNQTQMHGGGIG